MNKTVFASLITTLFIFTLLLAMLPLVFPQDSDTMWAPLGAASTIDGKWIGAEWDDALEYPITGSGGTSYVRVKHNSTHLFVIIDSPWDTSLVSMYDTENCWLAFDTTHNGGTAPQTDDWLFDNPRASPDKDYEAWDGTGTGWSMGGYGTTPSGFYANGSTQDVAIFGGPGLQTSPNSATPHRIDEVQVPLPSAAPYGIAGLYILVVQDTDTTKYVEWPTAAGGDPNGWPPWFDPCPTPNAWGDLKLGTPVGGTSLTVDKLSLLAPYIALVSMIAVAVTTATYFTRKKKTQ